MQTIPRTHHIGWTWHRTDSTLPTVNQLFQATIRLNIVHLNTQGVHKPGILIFPASPCITNWCDHTEIFGMIDQTIKLPISPGNCIPLTYILLFALFVQNNAAILIQLLHSLNRYTSILTTDILIW